MYVSISRRRVLYEEGIGYKKLSNTFMTYFICVFFLERIWAYSLRRFSKYNYKTHTESYLPSTRSTYTCTPIHAHMELHPILRIHTTQSSLLHTPRPPHSPILPPLQTDFIRPARLPRTQDQIHNILHALPILHLRKDRRSALSHLRRITLHHPQIRTHSRCQINLIHH